MFFLNGKHIIYLCQIKTSKRTLLGCCLVDAIVFFWPLKSPCFQVWIMFGLVIRRYRRAIWTIPFQCGYLNTCNAQATLVFSPVNRRADKQAGRQVGRRADRHLHNSPARCAVLNDRTQIRPSGILPSSGVHQICFLKKLLHKKSLHWSSFPAIMFFSRPVLRHPCPISDTPHPSFFSSLMHLSFPFIYNKIIRQDGILRASGTSTIFSCGATKWLSVLDVVWVVVIAGVGEIRGRGSIIHSDVNRCVGVNCVTLNIIYARLWPVIIKWKWHSAK